MQVQVWKGDAQARVQEATIDGIPEVVREPEAWLADGRVVYTSFADPTAPVLRWIDPAHPTVVHTIPTPAGAAPSHPARAG